MDTYEEIIRLLDSDDTGKMLLNDYIELLEKLSMGIDSRLDAAKEDLKSS